MNVIVHTMTVRIVPADRTKSTEPKKTWQRWYSYFTNNSNGGFEEKINFKKMTKNHNRPPGFATLVNASPAWGRGMWYCCSGTTHVGMMNGTMSPNVNNSSIPAVCTSTLVISKLRMCRRCNGAHHGCAHSPHRKHKNRFVVHTTWIIKMAGVQRK